jgi:uncharacterized protein (UPF0548 family)
MKKSRRPSPIRPIRLPSWTTLLVWVVALLQAQPASGGTHRRHTHHHRYDANTVSLSRSKLYRWRQRMVRDRCTTRRQRQQQSQQRPNGHHQRRATTTGSRLTWHCPTPAALANWGFGRSSGDSHDGHWDTTTHVCDDQVVTFNHNSVGMTNPCLHVAAAAVTSAVSQKSSYPTAAAAAASSSTKNGSTRSQEKRALDTPKNGWFPDILTSSSSSTWRVLKFHARVGQGIDCYQRVRDAALAWDFNSNTNNSNSSRTMGIMTVQPQRNNIQQLLPSRRRFRHGAQRFVRNGRGYMVLPANEERSNDDETEHENSTNRVQQIWSGPGRRLVTFTAIPLGLGRHCWMKLYCINPVHVVYDLVDQAAPSVVPSQQQQLSSSSSSSSVTPRITDTTCYSATAYATGSGHWLRGEERVTVALRSNGAVDVQILSLSQPASCVMGRLVWAVGIGRLQTHFFQQQLAALEQVGADVVATLTTSGQQQQFGSNTKKSFGSTGFVDL